MNVARDGTAIGSHPLTCLRKKRFATEAKAMGAIFNMRARNQDTERLQAYACEYCKQWHLGRLPPTLVWHGPTRAAT